MFTRKILKPSKHVANQYPGESSAINGTAAPASVHHLMNSATFISIALFAEMIKLKSESAVH